MERGREEFEEDGEKMVVVAGEDDDNEEDESVRSEIVLDSPQSRLLKLKLPRTAWISPHQLWPALPIYHSNTQLGTDLEQFARHAGRKSVNMEDVLLSTHRNEQLAMSLRSIYNEIRTKEAQSHKKKRKKPLSRKEDKQASSSSIPNAIASASTHINIMP